MAALFVKDLHPEVSEVILSNRFRPAGHVQSVHICRDRKTGSPLGYAYVNFRYRDDAERAIDMFSFELLLGRPMRVMWSNWEPTAKPIKGGNIFIRNLDWSIDCTSLFDTFSVFGRIVSCKVVESKGYGYVQYESAEAAERLNGKLLNDRQVTIEYFRSWEEPKVEVCRAEEPKVEARRAEEPKVEAHKAEEPKVEARKFIKKIDHTIHRKCLLLPPWFKRSTLKTPCTKDTVQSTKASASEDISQIVYTAASQMVQAAGSPAPVNNVEAVETAGPENSEESVETAASEGSVEAVKTVASDDRVEAVEATAPVEATETAAPEETLEAVSEIRIVYTAASQMVQAAGSPAPVNNVEAVETAGPENSEESVETAASEGSVEAVKTVASDDRVEAVEATAPVEATETAAPEETLEAVSEIRVPAPLQVQNTTKNDYLLPLVAEIHPADAKQITLMLVQGENNFKIMNMISDPEHLQAKVDKMDTLLRAREAGVKLVRIFN
ncbi:hypothetical protein KOW79_000098 [Hemibagrus wyckioides]|uniref:Uncharacterized protein n=2 Tax=Hemibagrus wyckioides TaxID=337641 RepID=A0A9D3S7Y0_9TELE|nr:hypothetical protein KOW79_000098 [Hemibagrus wyckioides]